MIDETVNLIISECSKLAEMEYKTPRLGGSGDRQWELSGKFKFYHTNKYMHNLEPVLENETHKVFWDFEIQTDHLISARRPVIVN